MTTGSLQSNEARTQATPFVHLHPELATLPVFVRPGTILPMAPLVESTSERPQGPLALRVFPGPDCAGDLYQDDGVSFAYKHGEYMRMHFTCSLDHGTLTIHVGKHEGHYPAWWHSLAVEVNGLAANPSSITNNGRSVTADTSDHRLAFTVADDGSGMDIVLHN